MRILIVKRDKLGDLLLTTPVFAYLAAARPDARIHLLANDYNAWVARGNPALARIWSYPRVRDGGRLRLAAAAAQLPLLWRLRRQRFDLAVVMGGDESHRGIRRALATGATRVIAYAQDPAIYGTGLTDSLPPPREGHETLRMLRLLEPMGIGMPESPPVPMYALPAAGATFASHWLAARGLARDAYIVIGTGARRAKKQPTAAQVARWSTRIRELHGLDTVLMWTPGAAGNPSYPGDDALAQAVLDRGLAHLHPFRGPIGDAVGLIFHARTTLMPDSGLMHFAAASPGGVLGLFADPLDSAPASRWAPLGPNARHIESATTVADLDDEVILAALAPLLDRDRTESATADTSLRLPASGRRAG